MKRGVGDMAKITSFDVDTQSIAQDPVSFATQVKKALFDIAGHLVNLSPFDNFSGFKYEGEIPASTEVRIKNRAMRVPEGYVVTFCKGGAVQAGDTAWSKDFVYLKNPGGSAITVKAFFFI